MPIYEYKCSNCDHRFEKLQKMSDDPLKDCPECNKSALVKLVSASKFKLKGTGWYETDFKNSKKSESKSNDSSDKKKTTESKKPSAKSAKS